MKPQRLMPLFHRVAVCVAVMLFVPALPFIAEAQPPARQTLQLSQDSATNSQLTAIRSDIVAAITQGASPAETSALMQRQRLIDHQLEVELGAIREELVAIEKGRFDRDAQQRRADLRRRESLLWVSRVELAALLSELFAEGSADGVALAQQTIHLIGEALAKFPNASELQSELARLLSESQLRSGNPDAALRTMRQASTQANRAAGEPPETERDESGETPLVINTADELAFVIRIDIAKHRWDAAADKLNQYFGDQPTVAPRSPSMDLARLRYLISQPDRSSDMEEVGRWLDAIRARGGAIAYRNAETLVARHRALQLPADVAAAGSPDQAQPPVDPRVLRADARYYLRVGETLPAAITFARAAVEDADATRSVESAIRSAAILQSVSKEAAAADLLRRIARAHQQHPSSPLLMLQAAALQDAVDVAAPSAKSPTARDLLVELIDGWPASGAAETARTSLIDSAVADNDFVAAAVLATQRPAEQWDAARAARCRQLWQLAIAGPQPLQRRCRWDQDDCARQYYNELEERLSTMRSTFAAAASHPLAKQTELACIILLDTCKESPARSRLATAEQQSTDPYLSSLARRRLGHQHPSEAPDPAVPNEPELWRIVLWRLHQDLRENPTLHREIGSYLVAVSNDPEFNVPPRLIIAWLMWSGKVDQGGRQLRSELSTSDEPGEVLAAAASALADSIKPSDLEQASRLWGQLADGIPTSHPSHRRAKVESIACLWRSGKRSDARAAAELMLLTNPPQDPARIKRLQEWAR